MMKGCVALNLLIMLATTGALGEETLAGGSSSSPAIVANKEVFHELDSGAKVAGSTREGKVAKIVGFYSQTTLLSLLTRTTSSIYTCLSTTATKVCNGRRRKRAILKEYSMDAEKENDEQLEGSSSDSNSNVQAFVAPFESIDKRTGRRVTVWSSIYSTLDIYTTVPIVGSTVTVSALCNVVGGSYVAASCFLG